MTDILVLDGQVTISQHMALNKALSKYTDEGDSSRARTFHTHNGVLHCRMWMYSGKALEFVFSGDKWEQIKFEL
jgi:hypothetical protein